MIAFVSDKESFQDQLEEALNKTHHVTGVRMEIGKTGLPHRGSRWIFIARLRDLSLDPVQVLKVVSVRKCVALQTLLDAGGPDLCAGWTALSKKKKKNDKNNKTNPIGSSGASASMPTVGGIIPEDINPSEILGRYPYIKKPMDALGKGDSNEDGLTARVVALLYWMEQQNASEGVVDVSKERTPVCVDGTIPDTSGKKLYIHRLSKRAIALNPYQVLSTLGYNPQLHNLALGTLAAAEAASKKALPCTLVFACLLACCKTLSEG